MAFVEDEGSQGGGFSFFVNNLHFESVDATEEFREDLPPFGDWLTGVLDVRRHELVGVF